MPKQAKKSPKDIVKTGREVAQVVEESKGQKFCKLEKLGEGAFGTAYRVQKTDNSDGKTYVLKEIRCRDKEQVIDALREMVTMRILQCPWVNYTHKRCLIFIVEVDACVFDRLCGMKIIGRKD
uniref:Protein kinase domain-containing protein n=1 Tax=Spongospora subterranea TaxID=70186 RepID=A0A0H5RR54_9EUKA|eukprot:CRZ11204.1 hypothetical protein [Spongospora subterranea]